MVHCWETPLSCMTQPLESRNVCRSEFVPIEPCYYAYHIDRRGNAEMLQVRFGKADITGAAPAKGPHALPKSSLRYLLAGHTLWHRRASFGDDGQLAALHVGPAVGW